MGICRDRLVEPASSGVEAEAERVQNGDRDHNGDVWRETGDKRGGVVTAARASGSYTDGIGGKTIGIEAKRRLGLKESVMEGW